MSAARKRAQLLLAAILVLVLLLPGGRSGLAWSGQHAADAEPLARPVTAARAGAEVQPPDEIAHVPGVNGDWWAAVQAQIRRDTYALTEEIGEGGAPSYQGQNPVHGFALTFTADGVYLAPTREQAGAAIEGMWGWHLRLTGYGYAGQVQPVASPVSVTADGYQIEYARQGLAEWYVNDVRGLEQGFVLDAPPAGKAGQGLILDMALETDLVPALRDDGQRIDFELAGGNVAVLHYGELYVADAAGSQLPAHLSLSPAGISIWIDDSGASYPLLVDPLVVTPDWTAGGDQAGAQLGYSVATAGDVNGDGYDDVIVGAPDYDNGEVDEGRVYVYHGSATGLSATDPWMAESNQAGASFGSSVGTAGDVDGDGYDDVIIGAPAYDGDQANEGRVYVYYGSATGLSDMDLWTDESDQGHALFGSSVGAAGDVNGDGCDDVIIGARLYDHGETNEGRAYVYLGSTNGLSDAPNWTAESDQADAWFGRSVGTAGDVNGDGYDDVIVGAHLYRNDQAGEGRAYVYYGSASGLPSTADWTAESDQAGYLYPSFGYSVGTAGDVNGDGYDDVIVGAPTYDSIQEDEGQAYVYHGSAMGLRDTANWTVGGDQAYAFFGSSVGTAGDVNSDGYDDVIISARYYDNGETDEGRTYIYYGTGDGLCITASWTAESDQYDAHFGLEVGVAGDVNGDGYDDVIVGANGYDAAGVGQDAGRAYVYQGPMLGLMTEYDWSASGEAASDEFGRFVATAGDVNGDGYSDVVVGTPYSHENGPDAGKVYIYHGGASGLGLDPAWTKSGEAVYDRFGSAVGAAGDLNGDGYDDLVVGAPGHDPADKSNAGKAYVYHGGPGEPNLAWTRSGENPRDELGHAVGMAGDVNRDGYGDLIIGAIGYPHGDGFGKTYVYHGSSAGLGPVAAWGATGQSAGDRFGQAVGTAGDVNGDGYADIIAGAPRYGASENGRAYVYHGSAAGLAPAASWMVTGEANHDQYGFAVGLAGDVNGDSYSDILIGAPFNDAGGADAGRTYVYHGAIAGLSATASWRADGTTAGDRLGAAVGTAGDVNGDGYADVLVGAYGADSLTGRLSLYRGSTSGLSMGTADWTASGERPGDQFGLAIGTAGDVNGDGYSDVVIGAPGCDAPGTANMGRAYAYHGTATGPQSSSSWDKSATTAAAAGDVNGDGFGDVIVGTEDTSVSVYYGSVTGPGTTPNWTVTGDQPNARFGFSVATAGDVNGDGYADVIVGAPGYDTPGFVNTGRAYVYHGSATGLSAIAAWTASGKQEVIRVNKPPQFGHAVATAGDVNGDGYSDVLVGAPGFPDIDRGATYVYYGSAAGLSSAADWYAVGAWDNALLGSSAGTAGDVNGDGYSDVIVGAPSEPIGPSSICSPATVYVYFGGARGLSTNLADWTAEGEDNCDFLGQAVGTAGDVNGDGYSDVIVGAPGDDSSHLNAGKIYVHHGSAQGLTVAFFQVTGVGANNRLGSALGTAGDVNGDGYADVIVGAPGARTSYIYYGGSTGVGTEPDWTATRVQDGFGWTAGTAGDVNGDGFADVALSSGSTVHLYEGGDDEGRLALARQTRGDSSGVAVQPWGPSYSRDSFEVSLQTVSPLGRGWTRLQVQACPPAVAFGDPACRTYTAGDWREIQDGGGIELAETISWLAEGTLYRWRARALYDSPLYPHGPWRRFQGQGQEADVRTGLLATDLQISKTMSPGDELTPPAPINYTLTFVAAAGPAVGVVLTDIVPAGIEDVQVTYSGVTITDTGVVPGYVWEVRDLAAGEGGVITITGVATVSRFVNTAVITSTSHDADPRNNVATAQTHVPGVVYVDAAARGTDDGSSWTNAYTHLQVALANAAAGDEVWVAEGVYRPTDGVERTATFTLADGVDVYGGFTGSEAYRHERDWHARRTVLSGDIGTLHNDDDNVYHVVTGGGPGSSAVLDGFVITGGVANGAGNARGGGLYAAGGSLTLRNLAFLGNAATYGGGLYSTGDGVRTLVNVVFSGNEATYGGGLYNIDGGLTLTNTTFSGNAATLGGGIANSGTGVLALTNGIVWGNTPEQIVDHGTGVVAYSDVQGGWPGTGNLSADPQFVDADGADDLAGTLDDDLRLHTTFRHPSPAIDAGDNSALPADADDLDGDGDVSEPLPLDASARARRIGFTAEPKAVDMGAFEANILDVLAEGKTLLDSGTDFRMEHLQLLSSDTLTRALQNYANFNDGEWYYDFCADYDADAIDPDGYCPPTGPGGNNIPRANVRNDLLDAVDLYRVAVSIWPTEMFTPVRGPAIDVWQAGGSGVLAATTEIANDHLIFGNEFLVDATDYRFSTAGIPYADQIIAQELDELAQAARQFELVMDLVFRAFGEWDVGEYCTADEFETFGVTSSLMMSAINETASRYYMLGQREQARNVYLEAERNQNLHLEALAALAAETGADYLIDGSYEMLNNLSQLRDRADAIGNGLDFYGFGRDYAPLQPYEQLLELVEGPTGNTGLLGTARDLEDQARDAQRAFDTNKSDMDTECDNLTVELDNQLFDLCGQSDDDYATCEGGLMGQNFDALDVASIRVGLAWLKAQNIAEQIQIEEERVDGLIQVTLRQGEQNSAAQLAIGKLQAYKETRTHSSASEEQLYAGLKGSVEYYTQAETKSSFSPWGVGYEWKSGFKASVALETGFNFSQTWVQSSARTWDPNAEEIGYWNSIQALQQAEAQAQIEGTNREAAVRNLLLQQSEALREYEIAMAEFDKLAAEHNHLAERRSRLLNKREQVVERVASHNSHLESPAYRIWRDSLTIQSAAAHALAAQYTYLTARASEYELLTPYPNLDEIFRARTANDIRLFLNDLKVWHQALDRPGQLNRYPYTLSLAEDIYQVAQGEMLPDAWGCRIVEDTLECEFSTMLDQRNAADQYLFSPNIWNNRIAGIGAPLASNAGIRVNIVTEQAVNAGNLEVVLIHGEEEGGAEKYRNVLDEIVEYDPGTAVPVGYLIPPGLNPANTTVVVRPDVNGQGGLANSGLVNLSVASSWILRIPADSRGDLDYAGIKDIEIYLDSTGRALPGWEAEAAEDAARLAAGLAMAPLSEARLREMAAPPSSAPGGPGLSLTHLAGRTLAPTIPGQIGGAYRGNLIITSPITVAVQLLNVDLWNDDGTLSGTVNVTDTALYSGSIGLRGTAAGDAFTLTSDQYSAVVAGRQVTQCFALAGHIVDSGDVLKAAYTGTITNLLPFPIVVQGSYSASRPAAPGSKRLLVGAPTWSVPAQASVPITGTLLDEAMELMTATQRISFTTNAGTVTPAAIDTVGGRAVVTFTAPAEPGEAVIVATTGEVTGWVRLQIESNGRPIADAGADQEVVPGDTVTLDGSGSSDPDGDPLIYSWVQTGGEAVSFTPTLSVTAFTAPAAGGPLTFALTVTDTASLTDTDTTVVTVTNVVPLADAGPDQTVDPGATVTLDGSGSSDPNGDPLIYGWVQTGGPPVSFTPTLSVTAFAAPAASGLLTFSLTVTDTDGFTDADTTVVTVTNLAPLADAGPDQPADPGATVTLDGSGSSDPNGDPLIYGWVQTGGTPVSFTPTLSVTAFTAPGSGGLLTFTLTVTDPDGLTDSDRTLVVMSNVVPLADAGPDQTVDPGDTVTLDGSASSDPNGDPLTYGWMQASGQPISFTEDISITTFTAPPSSGPLTFTLTVTDTSGLTGTDTTVITVAKTRRYLPVILKGYPPVVPAPDLVVTTATVHSNDVQVVIENQGDAPVLPDTPFWIDVYVAPDPAPTGVNQPWNALCEQGLVWGIPAEALPLDAGEAMTLTYSTDPGAPNLYYWDELSNFPGSLADRTPVYVQVDSWHLGTTYGAVLEGHELVGSRYNNIVGPVYATAGSGGMGAEQTGTQAPGRHLPASPDGLPPRP